MIMPLELTRINLTIGELFLSNVLKTLSVESMLCAAISDVACVESLLWSSLKHSPNAETALLPIVKTA